MVTKAVNQVHIVKNKNICGGQPRIAGTRIKVQHIVLEYKQLGWTPDQICDAHSSLTLADVHAAIAYYYDHKNEIDSAIQKDEKFVNRLRRSLT
ncbi:MAG: DUF433 domain-containing protein [Candidatus Aerophobetes bacterium]|nr:DUF433 domain-containing protein [Candidatus Aerophobetes bacterium]